LVLDGGRMAARGFRYQYLRTLEALLEAAGPGSPVHAVRVEGPAPSAPKQLDGADAVDFELVDQSGNCLMAVQVKSRNNARYVSAPEAFGTLLQLVEAREAETYRLLFWGTPDAKARDFARLIHSGAPAQELLTELRRMLDRAPRRQALLDNLTDVTLRRLQCSHVEFDLREDTEILSDLRQNLQQFRDHRGEASGSSAVGLLVLYLLGEVQTRASDPAQATWTVTEFQRAVLADRGVLNAAFRRRDYGVLVGGNPEFPDVQRERLMGQLRTTFFSPQDRGDRPVPLRVLTGLSGVGKSSLAAGWIAENADRYEVCLWASGESEESLLSAFVRFRDWLTWRRPATAHGDVPTAAAEDVRSQVFTLLSELHGRWLLVLDGVTSADALLRWAPSWGDGHVLITTQDRVGWPQGALIPVGPMTLDESLEFLSQRLLPQRTLSLDEQRQLSLLADEMGHWPLAMSLACGYLQSCGMSVADVPHYVAALRDRALRDQLLVPLGYPRTLVASIGMTVERLRVWGSQEDGAPAGAALKVLHAASFLAPRQIPLQLALSATLIDKADWPAPGTKGTSMGLDPQVPVLEVLRAVTRFGLADFDERLEALPVDQRPDYELDATFQQNTVLQEILRRGWQDEDDAHDVLAGLALFTEAWLTDAVDRRVPRRALVLAAHATTLLPHLRELGIGGEAFALLCGNTAVLHRAQGEDATARVLLEEELEHLQQQYANDVLAAQTHLALADLLRVAEDDWPAALQHLRRSWRLAIAAAEDAPKLTDHIATVGYTLLTTEPLSLVPAADWLRQRYLELRGRNSPSVLAVRLDTLGAITRHLSDGRAEEAERLCRQLLATPLEGAEGDEAEPRRFLVESLAQQGKWTEATAALSDLIAYLREKSLNKLVYGHLVHNAGMFAAVAQLGQESHNAGNLLRALIRGLDELGTANMLSEAERRHILILRRFADAGSHLPSEVLTAVVSAATGGAVSEIPWAMLAATLQQE
jgi:hypothetical protein